MKQIKAIPKLVFDKHFTDKVVKKIEQRTNRIGMFYANEEKTYNLIKKL